MYCNNSLDFIILVINYDSFIYLLVFVLNVTSIELLWYFELKIKCMFVPLFKNVKAS